MSERKNIDRLFQEKFKDFEANPADGLWEEIEARLAEKKRKRALPFWWKAIGVAAILVVGLWLGKALIVDGDDGLSPTHPIVTQENTEQPKSARPDENAETNAGSKSRPALNNKTKTGSESGKSILTPSQSEEAVAEQTQTPNANQLKPFQGNSEKRQPLSSSRTPKNTTVASRNASLPKRQMVVSDTNESRDRRNRQPELKSDNTLVDVEKQNLQSPEVKTIAESGTVNISKESPAATPGGINLDALKGNNKDKIAAEETIKTPDSVKNNPLAENSLEKLLNEKESKSKQGSKPNRWQLTSNVAPVFLGSMANGSPLDSTLVNNTKSYNTSVGYGLGVSYAVNNRLTVRTGLNKVNMSYNTNNIVYFAGIESRMLDNVKPTAAGANIQIETQAAATNSLAPSEADFLPFETSFVHKNKGYINQEMGYLEMPVEMTYALLDKRFGIKIIGGFSTLFLQDNAISVVSDNRSTYIGEASNLNDIHFSTNFGIGLKYGFLKSFEVNVEPTFKYQLNTFSSGAGNFKPYMFGIYSGISYKF